MESGTAIEQRILLLRKLPTPAMLSALGHGLSVASSTERAKLAVELLELALVDEHAKPSRRRIADAALAEVVRTWSKLPDEVRLAAGAVGIGRWRVAAADAVKGTPRQRGSVALLAEHLAEPALGELILELLSDETKEVAAAAERAILAMILAIRPRAQSAWLEPEVDRIPRVLAAPDRFRNALDRVSESRSNEERVLAVVAEAAWNYPTHRRRGVLFAALLAIGTTGELPECEAKARLVRLLAEGNHPAGNGLRSVLRWSRSPAVREAALVLLGTKAIAGPCVDRLSRAETAAEHEAVLRRSHLLLRSDRTRRLSRLDWRVKPSQAATDTGAPVLRVPPDGVLPDRDVLAELSVGARRGIARVVEANHPDPVTRRVVLEPMLADPDPFSRHSAMRIAPESLSLDHCFDEDPRIARGAMLRWSAVGVPGMTAAPSQPRVRAIRLLARSPHHGVRVLARQESQRLTENGVNASSALAVRRRWERDPHATRDQLAAMIVDGDPVSASEAIAIVRRLRVQEMVEQALIDAARTPLESESPAVQRVTASAAMALGVLSSLDSLRALHFCLSHQDSRVRANAVEAIARRARRGVESDPSSTRTILVELKGDADHRVRANALRGLFESAPASEVEPKPGYYESSPIASLLSMLSDDRQPHRRAALWLTGRVARTLGNHAMVVGSRMEEAARSEPDPIARARAARCASELTDRARSEWSSRAGSI